MISVPHTHTHTQLAIYVKCIFSEPSTPPSSLSPSVSATSGLLSMADSARLCAWILGRGRQAFYSFFTERVAVGRKGILYAALSHV